MTNISDDMVKITLNTSNFQDKNAEGALLSTYRQNLVHLDSDLKAFERAIQSATNSFTFFNTNLKHIEQSGLAQQSFFVKKEELTNAIEAIRGKSAELAGKRGGDYAFTTEEVRNITASKVLHGKRAQYKAMEEIDRLGGTAVINPSNPEKLDFTLPVSIAEAEGMTQKQKNAYITKAIPEAMSLSRKESARQREKEREAEDIKAERKADKDLKRTTHRLLKVISVAVIAISDIVRRILTATMQQATENNRLAREAKDVGMTPAQRREYDLFDIVHGMEKGTMFSAVQDIQSKFGDVTALDEAALEKLARVMGSEVADLVRSGMGGKSPDLLLDKILDKYFSQYLSGKNSLGQYVGTAQAKRELVTALKEVSPEIARVFSQWVSDYESGYYGKPTTMAEYKATSSTILNRGGLLPSELEYSGEIGKKFNEIIAIFESLKATFFTRLATSLDGLLTNIRNIRIGQSATSKIEEDALNKEINLKTKAMLQEQQKVAGQSLNQAIPELMQKSSVPKKYKYTGKILAGLHSGSLTLADIENNYATYGLSSAKEAFKYQQAGLNMVKNVLSDPSLIDELLTMLIAEQRIKAIDEANLNEIGSGKIPNLSVSSIGVKGLALDYVEKLGKDFTNKSWSSLSANEKNLVIQSIFNRYRNEDKSELLSDEYLQKKATRNAESIYSGSLYSQTYNRDKVGLTYLNAVIVDEMKKAIEASNSVITNALIEQKAIESGKNYRLDVSRDKEGALNVNIKMLDSTGKELSSGKVTINQVAGYEGTIYLRSDGTVSSAN